MSTHRFGQAIVGFLFLAAIICGNSLSYAASGIFYVIAGETFLRECPAPDCGVVTRLYRSDRVEYLDTNSYGWWKVRALRNGAVGWLTADILSAVPPTTPSPPHYSPKYFYVAASRVNLRLYPLYSSTVTGTVQLNDTVEKLGDSPRGWVKVRNLRDGAEGWMLTRYISPQPVSSSRRSYVPKRRLKQRAPADTEKSPPKGPEPETAKPM
ncbi:MAG: SH3 domain-containing protein [Desulfobacca sp.]|nr:SH3 domain-containing protein [Desulfobacca sp.]